MVQLSNRRPLVYAGSLAQPACSGGLTWLHLQFLLGFRRLGWDVLFIDRLEPEMCIDETGRPAPLEESLNLHYFLNVMRDFDLHDDFHLLYNRGRHSLALRRTRVLERD